MGRTNHNNKRKSYKKKFQPNKNKKGINGYIFYIGTTKQASNYEICAGFIINYIECTFDKDNNIYETSRT